MGTLVDAGLVSKHLSTNISGETPPHFVAFAPGGNDRFYSFRSGIDHIAFRTYEIAGTEPYLLDEVRVLTNPGAYNFTHLGQTTNAAKNVHYGLFGFLHLSIFIRYSESNQCSTTIGNDIIYYNKMLAKFANPPTGTIESNAAIAVDGPNFYVIVRVKIDEEYYVAVGRTTLEHIDSVFNAGNKMLTEDAPVFTSITIDDWHYFSETTLGSTYFGGADVKDGILYIITGLYDDDTEPYAVALCDLRCDQILSVNTLTSPETAHYPKIACYADGLYYSVPSMHPSPQISSGIRYTQWAG